MENQKNEINECMESPVSRKPWSPMNLTYLGQITEVVQGGGGKCTTVGGDPGDARKPSGGGDMCT